VSHSPLAALCRAAASDHPKRLRCALLDVQPGSADIPPEALSTLFRGGGGVGGGGGGRVGLSPNPLTQCIGLVPSRSTPIWTRDKLNYFEGVSRLYRAAAAEAATAGTTR